MSNNQGIPQRARRSESMTGAEALIDLLVSPPPANKPNTGSSGNNVSLASATRISVGSMMSSGGRPDRLAEVSPLSPRRSKAVAALSGLAGMTGFQPEASPTQGSSSSSSYSPSSSPSSTAHGAQSKGRSGKSPSSKKKTAKDAGVSSTGKRKHGSGPAHKPGTDGTENVGRWTTGEHNRFLKGLEIFNKDWKNIAALVGTRTVVQVRSFPY
jgi:hypothetical protein